LSRKKSLQINELLQHDSAVTGAAPARGEGVSIVEFLRCVMSRAAA
jgi:hypothetical protein